MSSTLSDCCVNVWLGFTTPNRMYSSELIRYNLLQDSGPGIELNSSATLNILIDDADDLPAEFSPSSYEAEVPENAAKVGDCETANFFYINYKLYLLYTNPTLDKRTLCFSNFNEKE